MGELAEQGRRRKRGVRSARAGAGGGGALTSTKQTNYLWSVEHLQDLSKICARKWAHSRAWGVHLRGAVTRDARARGRAGCGAEHRQSSAHSAHRWAVARPAKSSTAEIRAHPDFRVKNIEKYVSLRST